MEAAMELAAPTPIASVLILVWIALFVTLAILKLVGRDRGDRD